MARKQADGRWPDKRRWPSRPAVPDRHAPAPEPPPTRHPGPPRRTSQQHSPALNTAQARVRCRAPAGDPVIVSACRTR